MQQQWSYVGKKETRPLPTTRKTAGDLQKSEGKTGKPNGRRGWEQEWKPADDIELSLLVDRNDPVRKLIDHNLRCLTSLYFVREKKGNTGMVRTLLERQLKLGRVIKGLNFIGDDDN